MREVLIYEDNGTFFASVPSAPKIRIQGYTFDAVLSAVRAALRSYHDEPTIEPKGSLALIARDVTPVGIEDVRVFSPMPPTSQGRDWAIDTLRQLIAEGKVPASTLQEPANE